ncbi:hypothetical protein WJX73_009476 [Symbiochloris irregularis]|uniref:Uncharacterized protein n=1 Tax=Symbiochloris irregularis TaxID=706552 RepID=A0AAW1NY80_9CHLO
MLRSPVVQAVGSAVGTLALAGAGTLLVVSVASGTATQAIKVYRARSALPCKACRGQKSYLCQVCRGNAVLEWPVSSKGRLALCPVCKGSGEQNCLNCLGEGKV